MHTRSKRTLALRKETLRELTGMELSVVHGAATELCTGGEEPKVTPITQPTDLCPDPTELTTSGNLSPVISYSNCISVDCQNTVVC